MADRRRRQEEPLRA